MGVPRYIDIQSNITSNDPNANCEVYAVAFEQDYTVPSGSNVEEADIQKIKHYVDTYITRNYRETNVIRLRNKNDNTFFHDGSGEVSFYGRIKYTASNVDANLDLDDQTTRIDSTPTANINVYLIAQEFDYTYTIEKEIYVV